jgi:4-hydroxybenzoate polyprenyltransferase
MREYPGHPIEVTRDYPWTWRFLWWLGERFPPVQGMLFFVLYVTALLLGRYLTHSGTLQVGFQDIIGFFAFYAFFFMLRVFDEHKDYEQDCRTHPERILQRGLITLGHLKVLCAVAILIQVGISFWWDRGLGPVTKAWLVTIVWSVLMVKEFFCGQWLRKRLILYAFSHMLVMPMALVWAATFGTKGQVLVSGVSLLALLSFVSGFAFEISRKIKAPEDERQTVDSYSKIFGTHRAPWVVVALLVVMSAFLVMLLRFVLGERAGVPWMAGPILIAVVGSLPFFQFSRTPTPDGAKRMEAAAGGVILFEYLVLILALVVRRGIQWI